jgi:spermidine/putrescine transport system permease protein
MKRNRALGIYAVFYLAFLYGPVLMLPLFSFNNAATVAFPLTGFSLQWYGRMFSDPSLRAALIASLQVAAAASTISTCAGTLTSYALTRQRGWLTRPVAGLAVLPLFIPGIILGIALLIAVNLIGLGPSLIAVAIGHIAVCLPLTIVIMRGRFMAMPRSLDEAAMDLGASPFTAFRRVALPVVLPGFLSCLILTFTTSIDEFIVSFFLVGDQETLPLYIWDHLRFPEQLPMLLALGTLILSASVVLVLLAEFLRRRGAATA